MNRHIDALQADFIAGKLGPEEAEELRNRVTFQTWQQLQRQRHERVALLQPPLTPEMLVEGLIVRLASGSPPLTVELARDLAVEPLVQVVWFDEVGHCHRNSFHLSALRIDAP